ncbi:MAG: hypothetical protein ACXAE3_06705 [Candidatus Kariarchaeaceae archaeon]
MVDVTNLDIFQWILLLSGIAILIGALYTLNTYRISKSFNYLLLSIFFFAAGSLIVQAVFVNLDTYYGRFWSDFGNKSWFILGYIGLKIMESGGKHITSRMKQGYLVYSAANLVHFLFMIGDKDRYINYWTIVGFGSDPIATFDIFFNFYLQSFIGSSLFLYAIYTTTAINPRASRIRFLWMLGVGCWTFLYVMDVILLLTFGISFGGGLGGLIGFALYLTSTITWIILLLFYPESLFISRDLLQSAKDLYLKIKSGGGRGLGYDQIRDYLLSIPDETWEYVD